MHFKMIKGLLVAAFITSISGCAPVSINAPFAKTEAGRQEFVQSVVPGQTTLGMVITRYGKPTSFARLDLRRSPYAEYFWEGGFNWDGGFVAAKVDADGVVQSVRAQEYERAGAPKSEATTSVAATAPSKPEVAPVSSSSGTLTAALALQMESYSEQSGATPQGFLQRFGQPVTRENFGGGGLFENLVNEPTERWTYGTPLDNSSWTHVCNRPAYVTVDVYGRRSSNLVVISNSNLLGLC